MEFTAISISNLSLSIMNVLFVIDTSNGTIYYAIFNLASLLLGTAIAFYSGYKKGYPVVPWILIILTGGLFYMLGNKLITYSPIEWKVFLSTLSPPTTSQKVILGGIAGLAVGLLLAKKWFRFHAPVLDQYAVALPLSMAISRIGCLKAGCCYGTVTHLPWAIQYYSPSPAFQSQLLHSQVQFDGKISAAVHPVQLYEMIGCLLIAFLAWQMRKKLKAPGSNFLLFLVCYAGLRFMIEFLRSPDADLVMGRNFHGLKSVQWLLLAILLIGMALLVAREYYHKPINKDTELCRATKLRQVALVIATTSIALFMRKLFTGREYTIIIVFLIPVNAYMLGKIIYWVAKSPHYAKLKLLYQRRSR